MLCTGLATIERIDAKLQALRRQGRAACLAADSTPPALPEAPDDPSETPEAPSGASIAPEPEPEPAKVDLAEDTRVREAFDRFDTNGDGTLDKDEVHDMGVSLGRYIAKGAELDEAMEEMGGGPVSFESFSEWWHAGGKLSAAERFELKWQNFGNKFDNVLNSALETARSEFSSRKGKTGS